MFFRSSCDNHHILSFTRSTIFSQLWVLAQGSAIALKPMDSFTEITSYQVVVDFIIIVIAALLLLLLLFFVKVVVVFNLDFLHRELIFWTTDTHTW